MKIADYITTHKVTALVPSEVNPPTLPPKAYDYFDDNLEGKMRLNVSFEGKNQDGLRCVTIYETEGIYIVLEPDKRRIKGKITEDNPALG